jgi:Uma2 family endonuclease
VQQKIVAALVEYERATGGLAVGSPIDIVFDDYNVVQPDAVFFVRDRLSAIDMNKVIRIPPDLAVEVLSPSTAAIDRGRKMRSLARFGVREYWIVDPSANTVEQYVLTRGRYALHATRVESDTIESALLAGLGVPAARIFDF